MATKSSRNRTLQSELAARRETSPDGNALTFIDSRGRFEWRSFGDLYNDAARCGAVLQSRGLRRGDSCVLVMPSDVDACHAVLACLLVGAKPVLVAPPVVRGVHSNLASVVSYVARKMEARMLIVGDDAVDVGASLQTARSDVAIVFAPDDWADGDAQVMRPEIPKADDIAAYQLTSGTTGFPKICVWEHGGILASLDGMWQIMDLSTDDVFLNWTPLYHDMGLMNNFMLCMIHGIPLAMIETMEFLKRPSLWLRGLELTGSTTTWSPNFGYTLAAQRIADRELEGVDLSGVKGFWNAAERIHLDTMLTFQQRFERYGVSLRAMKTNFGCAENVGGATFSDPNGDFVVERVRSRKLYEDGTAIPVTDDSDADNAVDVVSVGMPFPGMTIGIFSRNGHELADGRVGEVGLATPSRMREYLGNQRETNRAIKGDYLRTGDLGYKRGDDLFWVGRVKERINLHGKKYDPSDFEKALFEVSGLRKGCFAAFGVDDTELGTQRLVIVSETSDRTKQSDADIFQDVKEKVLEIVGVGVDEVVFLKQGTMTKTSSGKRRHQFYRQQHVEGQLQRLAGARALTG